MSIPVQAAACLLCGSVLGAQVSVNRRPDGRVVYSRPPSDPVFNSQGIGRPPAKSDRIRWYAYDTYIIRFCMEEGVDPVMAKAIIWCESRFNWRATSSAGAMGLMQLMSRTAKRFGHQGDPYDPIENIRAGIQYVAYLQSRFKGNLILTAAAYNAGEGAVEKHGGVPPFSETRAYVPAVLATWDWIQRSIMEE